jgi:dTDP-glucose 4,6-dehydratase
MTKYPYKRVMVTGGAGFIGSCFIKKLSANNENVEIINLDNLSYAVSPNTLELLNKLPRYSHSNIDISDGAELKKVVKEFSPDLLINFAAESHVDNSIDSALPFINTNIIGTFNLLESVQNISKKDKCLFHHVSTDEVYGDLEEDDMPFSESNQYQPSSPYSASKAASDMLVLAWGRTHKIPYLITNCSNNFGPRQYLEKFIPKIICNAINNIEIPIYGDGKNIRDWIFVEDHIEIILKLHAKYIKNDCINIGSKCEKSNIEILETISKILENKYSIQPKFSFIKDRPGHDRRYAIDISKAEDLLDIKITHDFQSNMEKTIDWYINNHEWWEN